MKYIVALIGLISLAGLVISLGMLLTTDHTLASVIGFVLFSVVYRICTRYLKL